MIDEDVRKALEVVFPGTELIHAHDNGPRPDVRYITVRIESPARRLPSIVGKQDAQGNQPRDAHRTGSVELQAFGVGSFDLLDEGLQRLDQENAIAAAEARHLVFAMTADVQEIPLLRNQSEWEPRAVATLSFAYTRRTLENLSWIETVEGEIAVGDLPVDSYTATITPEVP
jgi:hypothetical protein